MEKSALIIQSDQQNFQNVNNREVIIIEHIQTKQEYLNKPSNLKKVPGSIWLSTSGQPIYLPADICHFFIYRHWPISVISSADLKSGMSAGSPVLLVRWNVRCCCMWRTPSQKFWNIQQQSWKIKARLKFWYYKVLWPYIYYILLVNYEVLLNLVKEKTNSTEPSGTGLMLQLVEGSLTCS